MSRPLVVDLYARLSRCPTDGSLEKVDKQLIDCHAVADRNGWTVGAQWDDPDLSAWRRGVRRKGWEALLARLESGATDGVVVWHTDRLLRQPRDLERLIDLGQRGLVVASAYGQYDLANSDHRLALRILTATACKASDDTSRRLINKFAMMREAGQMAGRARAFGFPGGDRTGAKGEDGKLPPVPAGQVERERAALRQAAEDVVDGVPLSRIARDWNAAGLRSATGAEWSAVQVRQVLARGSNAGLIEHGGVTVGRMPGDPILDQELYDQVRAAFAGRRRGRVAGERYLASGILLCGACGKPLSGRPHVGYHADGEPRRQYHCPRGRGGCGQVAADVRRVDAALRDFAVRRLGDPAHVTRLAAAAEGTARRAAEIAEQITQAQTVREALGDRLGRGEIDLDTFDAAIRPLTERLARLQVERDALAAEPAGDLPDPDAGAGELARQWDDGDVAEQRSLLLMALRGRRARLLPAQGRRTWSEDRVEIAPIPTE